MEAHNKTSVIDIPQIVTELAVVGLCLNPPERYIYGYQSNKKAHESIFTFLELPSAYLEDKHLRFKVIQAGHIELLKLGCVMCQEVVFFLTCTLSRAYLEIYGKDYIDSHPRVLHASIFPNKCLCPRCDSKLMIGKELEFLLKYCSSPVKKAYEQSKGSNEWLRYI